MEIGVVGATDDFILTVITTASISPTPPPHHGSPTSPIMSEISKHDEASYPVPWGKIVISCACAYPVPWAKLEGEDGGCQV